MILLSQNRKNLVKEEENTQNTLQRPVTRLERGTEDKENNRSVSKEALFYAK